VKHLRAIRSKLSYANVIASIAMFLALTGGTVMAAKLRSSDLAANSVKKKQLAKNSVTSQDFAKKSLIVSSATGGGQAANLAATPPTAALPLPLTGKATFTPKKGAVGLVMAEAKATLASAAPPAGCSVFINVLVNGEIAYTLVLSDLPDNAPGPSTGTPFTDTDWGSAPIGLTGGTQTISAQYNGDPAGCTATSKIDQLRVVVQRSR
jgi:hypothetical protein